MIGVKHKILTMTIRENGSYSIKSVPYFQEYLVKKLKKFYRKYGKKYLIYSIGLDVETETRTVSIVHPFDEFNPEIAEEIIRGRIARMDGNLREPYNPIPEYIKKRGI
jgi:CRISPR/Cas system-associated endonuclease Cas1